MATKSVHLPPESLDSLRNFDHSVIHWSVELGKAELRVREIQDTLASIYAGRKKHMLACLASSGVQERDILASRLEPDGSITVELRDAPPA